MHNIHTCPLTNHIYTPADPVAFAPVWISVYMIVISVNFTGLPSKLMLRAFLVHKNRTWRKVKSNKKLMTFCFDPSHQSQ